MNTDLKKEQAKSMTKRYFSFILGLLILDILGGLVIYKVLRNFNVGSTTYVITFLLLSILASILYIYLSKIEIKYSDGA